MVDNIIIISEILDADENILSPPAQPNKCVYSEISFLKQNKTHNFCPFIMFVQNSRIKNKNNNNNNQRFCYLSGFWWWSWRVHDWHSEILITHTYNNTTMIGLDCNTVLFFHSFIRDPHYYQTKERKKHLIIIHSEQQKQHSIRLNNITLAQYCEQ